AAGITPDIVWMPDPANNIAVCTGGCQGTMQQFADAMRQMVWNTFPGVSFEDFHDLFNDSVYINAVNRGLYYTDGIHLSFSGKKEQANYLFGKVAANYRPGGYGWQQIPIITNTVPVTAFSSSINSNPQEWLCAGIGGCTYTLPGAPTPLGCWRAINTNTATMTINPNGITV